MTRHLFPTAVLFILTLPPLSGAPSGDLPGTPVATRVFPVPPGSVESLRVSPGGRYCCLVFVSGREKKVAVNGRVFGDFVRPGTVLFSGNGSSWGLTVSRGGSRYLLIDGKPRGPYEEISSFSYYSPSRWQFSARKGEQWYYVNSSRVWGPLKNCRTVEAAGCISTTWGCFSPKPDFLILAQEQDDRHYAIVHGKSYGPYREMGEMSFTLDGSHWGIFIKRDGEELLLMDGKEYGPCKFSTFPFYSDRSAGFAFEKGGRPYLMINGREHGPFPGPVVGSPLFYNHGKKWIYTLKKKEKQYLIQEKISLGPYDEILSTAVSEDGGFLLFSYRQEGEEYVYAGGKTFGPFGRVTGLSLEGKDWAFSGRRAEGRYFTINGQEYGPFKENPHALLFPRGGSPVLLAQMESRLIPIIPAGECRGYETYRVFTNGKEPSSSEYSAWGLIGTREGKTYVYTGSKEYGPYDYTDIPALVFSPRKSWAFTGRRGKKHYLIIDGREYGPFEGADLNPGGGTLAAAVLRGKRVRIYRVP